jgi:FAD dependent oxidoreductase
MQRRQLLSAGASVLSLGLPSFAAGHATATVPPTLAPVRAKPDRLIDFNVCTRPFRPQGPRIEAQQLHGKTVVHHYGHGGSGWSLSWGSARQALPLILATRAKRIAVIGCGAIGLTTARVAQQAGLQVRIYCKDEPPAVASSGATGLWTPDSRICTEEFATDAFKTRWEAMTRSSFKTYQSMLGLPGEPVQWRDGYILSDIPFDQPLPDEESEPEYPDLHPLVADLRPRSVALAANENPFRVAHARRFTQMVFSINIYQRLLMDDFLRHGGTVHHRVFENPRQFSGVPEHTIVNCTGYGARALMKDDSIVPVRGQTARLIPQPEVDYALIYRGHNLVMVPRHDGILVQAQDHGDYGNADTTIHRAQSEAAALRLAELFKPA